MNIPQTSTTKEPESLWKLGGLTVWQLIRNVFDEIIDNNVFGLAAELAFYFLFALFPLILILVTLFGMFASQRVELQDRMLAYLAAVLPTSAFELLQPVVSDLAAHATGGKQTFGIVSALWGVSGGINAMVSSLNLGPSCTGNAVVVQSARLGSWTEHGDFDSAGRRFIHCSGGEPNDGLVGGCTWIASTYRLRREDR